jgi:NAD+ synthetase
MPTSKPRLPDEPVRGNRSSVDDLQAAGGGWHLALLFGRADVAIPEGEEADYRACMLGLRDYVNKNGFRNVVLGLSGGIDSAICAALAVDALGEERVRAVMLPYRYTSESSLHRCRGLCPGAGLPLRHCGDLQEPVQGFLSALGEMFEGTNEGITEENLQSRARGVILMAISNKFGSMVVTTGNKSEMSVGYATLYGDMNGGFNPIKDLYKMQVYALSRWRNTMVPPGALGPTGEVIPVNIIDKAPSAELRPDQTDQDSLPPYPVLDDILECLVEHEMGVEEIVARGHDIANCAPDRASSLHRRIQAPPVGSGRQDHPQEFRPRPPISDHQQVSGPVMPFLHFLRDNARWDCPAGFC